jgi:hypothetical protein
MSGNEPDTLGADGVLNDDVSSYPATGQQMQSYWAARQQLAQFEVPVLVHAGDPHERLYVACFDGTGNDGYKDPAHATNVFRISEQIDKLKKAGDPQISGGYVPGPGTQGGLPGFFDSISGGTYQQRIEEMYRYFIKQAWEWKQADPQAQIRLADIGFSRGAEQAAGFARLVHERGIQDPNGAEYDKDANGMIISAHYTNPPLVAPGQVLQVEGLFDAVGTGEPYQHDRRPPPSVVSGLHIMALDEHRGAFPSDQIIGPGLTPDGRLLGLQVTGAHSDVGGGYHRNGLAIRAGNMMADYLNQTSERPFLQRSVEPGDPRLTVVHHSEQAPPFNAMPKDDPRGIHQGLVPQQVVQPVYVDSAPQTRYSERPGVQDPYHAEPRDESLNSRLQRRPVGGAAQPQSPPPPQLQPQSQADPGDDLWARVDRMLAAAEAGNWQSFDADTRALAAMPAAQEMLAQASAQVDLQEQLQAAQQALEEAQRQQARQQQDAPAMRMTLY